MVTVEVERERTTILYPLLTIQLISILELMYDV